MVDSVSFSVSEIVAPRPDALGLEQLSGSIARYSLEELQQLKPETKTEQAKKKLFELRAFRDSVKAQLLPIQGSLRALQAQFYDKVYSQEDDAGILLTELLDYKECLELDSGHLSKLDSLLREDESRWAHSV
mmetsp:Transcript_11387/g.15316  ORF Transcript_11387/g.15316 Transcript_11387/m.15316 type:complete len:132 (+) Transcript_11387:15-410(+)